MADPSIICIAIGCIIAIPLLIVITSLASLEPLEVGITYNQFTKSIGKETYEGGRYLIGPFNSFLIYPANLVTIEFSDSKGATSEPLQTRTAEGLGLTLYISFQYQINKKELTKLYNMANVNYHGTYVRISRDVILKIAGMYNATNYWTDRQKIGDHMKSALDLELVKAFASCISLQVLRIDLPNSYEDSIVATQVEVQKTNMRKFEQQAELIRQNILVIVSEAEQKIRVTNATGFAEAYRIKQFAYAKTLNNTLTAESAIYKQVNNLIGFNTAELTEYIYLNSLMDQHGAKILVGLKNTILNFGTSATSK